MRRSLSPFAVFVAAATIVLAGCGGSGSEPAPPAAAFIVDGLEYRFDYELDATGRVASYRIARRADVAYPTTASDDPNLRECTGSFAAAYRCTSNTGFMRGEDGRLVEVQYLSERDSVAYEYGSAGLQSIVRRWTGPGSHTSSVSTETLLYDEGGRLKQIASERRTLTPACIVASSLGTVALDAAGRLAAIAWTRTAIPDPDPACSYPAGGPADTTWSYAGGYLVRRVDSVYSFQGNLNLRTTVAYEVDSLGWLRTRTVQTEAPDTATTTTTDRYSFVTVDGRVAEESFTQAEPALFYRANAPQTVRYEVARRPVEPLFVPRALTGRAGDYAGMVSSHQR